MQTLKVGTSPGGAGQLVGTAFPTSKRFRFDPRSGHIPGATNQCFPLTLMSLFLSLYLPKINNYISSGEDFFKIGA